MGAKSKIKEYLKYKGISPYQFTRNTGFSNGFLDSGKDIGTDKLSIIIEKYPDLSLSWLLLDEGNMIREAEPVYFVDSNGNKTEQTQLYNKTNNQNTLQMDSDLFLKLILQKDAELRQIAEELGAVKKELDDYKKKVGK